MRSSLHVFLPHIEGLIPKRPLPKGIQQTFVATPNRRDEDVQTAVFLNDSAEKVVHLHLVCVIELHRNAEPAPPGDFARSFVN